MPDEDAREGTVLLKDKAMGMTLYLMPCDHRRVKVLSAQEETSIQALFMEGLDMVLAQRGLQPVERWEPRRKHRRERDQG